jgi:phosphoglycolate phosphatase
MTILFDLDGTLTDSYVGFERSIRFAVESLGLTPPDDVRRFLGPPLVESFTSLGMTAVQVESGMALYRQRYGTIGYLENEVYPGIADLLAVLVADGAELAVATSKPEPTARVILEHFDLSRHFVFIGGATFDGTRSHKHDVVAHTLAALGNPPIDHVVMVGDRFHDVHGAGLFGIATIGVTWGFGGREELEQAGAAAIVSDSASLYRAIRDHLLGLELSVGEQVV